MFKLEINIKLNWNSYIKAMKIKMTNKTWHFQKSLHLHETHFFLKIKPMYFVVIKPAMTYASIIWHKLKNGLKNKLNEKMLITQNKCLKTIIDIFKIKSIRVLKIKTQTFLLIIQLNKLQTKVRMRLRNMS